MSAPFVCYRCLRDRPHDYRLKVCRACKAAIEAQGLVWCNTCERAAEGRRSLCNACRNTKQRARYAKDDAYRAHRQAQGRAWWRANPDYSLRRYARWRLTRPAWYQRAQQTQNDRRWRRAQTDAAYREKRRAASRAWYARSKE